MNACASVEMLEQFLAGSLPEAQVQPLRQHLAGCARCQALLDRVSDDPELRQWASAAAAQPIVAPDDAGLVRLIERLRDRPPVVAAETDSSGAPPGTPPPGPASAAPAAPLGTIGPYSLLAEVGRGGMGTVYKAQHRLLKRVVALKVLAAERMNDATAVARFRREMEAVGQLHHPNIVEARDAGEADGTHFLVMDFVEGQNLSQLVKRHGPLPVADACEVIRQAAAGLQHAHEYGLVHRDIKPSNLLLTPAGQVKVLDLGLALLQGERRVGEELTQPGQVMGTLEYMAPEQALDTHTVDIRADIYSLGCTLYYLLAGQPPFAGSRYKSSLQKMMAHAQEPVPPIEARRPEVSLELAAVLERLLAKKPAERFQTPAEVVKALEPFAFGCRLSNLVSSGLPKQEAETRGEGAAAIEGRQLTGSPEPLVGKITENDLSSPMTGTRSSQEWVPAKPAVPEVLRPEPRQLTETATQRVRPALSNRKIALGVMVAMLLLGSASLLVPQIILRIQGRDGKETTYKIPEGSEVKVEKDGNVTVTLPPGSEKLPTRPQVAPVVIQPERFDLSAGVSLSAMALVSNPSPIKGIRSWTLETQGHRGGVNAVAYSPDGRWFASAGDDGAVRLWESRSNQLSHIFLGHSHRVLSLAWSPDSKIVASASCDETVRLWDVGSGQHLTTFQSHSGWIRGLAWSPDGKTLASGDHRVRLWDAGSGQLLEVLEHNNGVAAVAWSADSRVLASGGRDHAVRLWDATSGKLLHTLQGHADTVLSLAWSPDGKILASAGGADKTIVLWDGKSGQILRRLQGHAHSANTVAWSPDGRVLASGDRDYAKSVLLWDAESGRQVRTLVGHTDTVRAVVWSPDGKALASASSDSTVRLWDPMVGQHVRTLQGHTFQGFSQGSACVVAWSPDGKTLASGNGNDLTLLDARTGQTLRSFRGNPRGVTAVAFSPDGRILASADWGGMIRLLQITSDQPLLTFGAHTQGYSPIVALAWSPNGKFLASGSFDKTVRLWDTDSGRSLHTLKGSEKEVFAVAWSPNSTILASGDEEGIIRLWEADSGRLLRLLTGHTAMTCALTWSADGKSLASGSEDGTVRLWDIGSGHPFCTFHGHTDGVYSLAWSGDGKTVVSAGKDRTIRFWDTHAEGFLRTIPGPVTYRGVFSSDLRMLATSIEVQWWETETGRRCLTRVALRNDQYVTASADGHYRGSPQVEQHLVYVVQTDQGQETLTPEEFAKKYGWKNDPERVRLTASPPPQKESK